MNLFKDYGLTIEEINNDTAELLASVETLKYSDDDDEKANALNAIFRNASTVECLLDAFYRMAKENGYTK